MKLGKSSISELVAQIQKEKEMSRDFIVPTQELHVTAEANPVLVMQNRGATEVFGINENAHRQIASRLGIPFKYYERMKSDYPQLLAENVNGWFAKEPEQRMLRTMGGTARAFLSNKYRRIDNLELMQAVYPVLQDMQGVKVMSCEVTDSHLYLQVVSDRVQMEVAKGDIVQAGFIISNSEVGHGAVSVQPLVYRLVCTNGMIAKENAHKRYHTGKQIEMEDDYELFSDNTKILDDMAYFAKVQEIVRFAVDETKFNQNVIAMQKALGVAVSPMAITPVVEELGKTFALSKGEQEMVVQNFLLGDNYDGGHIQHFNQFGLSNAVTKTANTVDSYERAVELEKIGGSVLFADLGAMLADKKVLVA